MVQIFLAVIAQRETAALAPAWTASVLTHLAGNDKAAPAARQRDRSRAGRPSLLPPCVPVEAAQSCRPAAARRARRPQ